MRKSHALVCAAIAGLLTGYGNAETAEKPHTVIGAQTPNDLTAQVVFDLPKEERSAWIHGGVIMMIQTTAAKQNGSSHCVKAWYFDYPETHGYIVKTMEMYPNQRASAVLYALAGDACESFLG